MRILSALILSAICFALSAQLPSDMRSEQVYLSVQSSEVEAGDSINLQGLVACASNQGMKPYSRYLYVELIGFDNDSVLVRQKVACNASGQFATKVATDPLASGIQYVRAYTQLMRNFSPDCFALKPIVVNHKFPQPNPADNDSIACTICPVGGFLVPEKMQSIVVRVANHINSPIGNQRVWLVDALGDTVDSRTTSPSGLAMFSLMPQSGMSYQVKCTVNGNVKTFDVPATEPSKTKIQGSLNGNRVRFEIVNMPADSCSIVAYDRANGVTLISNATQAGVFTVQNKPQLITLFLIDKNLNEIAQCTLSSRYTNTFTLNAPNEAKTGQEIAFSIATLPDSAVVMARVVPDNCLWESTAEETITYTSDLASPLPFPEHAFAGNQKQRAADILAWLSTAHFKRFPLKDLIKESAEIYTFQPEMVMNFGGRVMHNSKKPFNGTLVAYNTETNGVYDTEIDKNGYFRIAVDDFTDGTDFYMQALNAKGKPESAQINIDSDSYPAVTIPRKVSLGKSMFANADVSLGMPDWSKMQLPEIIVKARINRDQVNTTSRFYGNNYKDSEEIKERNLNTLYDVLKQIPSLIVEKRNLSEDNEGNMNYKLEYFIGTKRGRSNLRGTSCVKLILDGFEQPEDMYPTLMEMPTSDIESVEYLQPWQAITVIGGAIEGAVVVKTFNAKASEKVPSKGTMYSPMGLAAPTKAFSPIATKPGKHKLIVDVIANGAVQSWEHPITITD